MEWRLSLEDANLQQDFQWILSIDHGEDAQCQIKIEGQLNES